MEFKAGDRVHVTRLDGEKVDFYATLTEFDSSNEMADLVNSTDSSFKCAGVYLPNSKYFGPGRLDYYTLATDEEDTEEPEVQHIDNKNILNTHGGKGVPTIKTKKEMNLPQLIEWGWKNIEQVERKEFKSNVRDSFGNYSTVQFSVDGYGFKTDGVSHKDTFTVEIEEEITEDTVLPKAIAVFKHTTDLYTDRLFSKSINEILKLDDKVTSSDTKTIYVLNNDGTLTLIWTKEQGLVE